MAQNQPFEIPQQLRELAERNVEQARAAYGQFMDAMVQATGMWMAAMPSNEMTSGFKVVQERAIRFAKQNAEACFALASELANAKDIQDVGPQGVPATDQFIRPRPAMKSVAVCGGTWGSNL